MSVYTAEEIPHVRAEIKRGVESIRNETTLFIEHQRILKIENPRVPIFFVKAHNLLRSECESIEHTERVLNFLPQAVKMVMLTEIGPEGLADFPTADEHGMLVGPNYETTIAREIQMLLCDVTEYLVNAYRVTGTLLPLPYSFTTTFVYFHRKLAEPGQHTLENRRLVSSINKLMQKCISEAIGKDKVPADYVKETMEY